MTSKVTVGTIQEKGGLREHLQTASVILKLGEEPKIGLELILPNKEGRMNVVQFMFNREEVRKGHVAKLIRLLEIGEYRLIKYSKYNHQRKLI
jgi:hypothetical protein